MLFHPLFRLLASRPQLVVDHLAGYAELASAQARGAWQGLQWRALLAVVAALGLLLAVAFGGVALLLLGAVPPERMHMPWLLWAVPLVPLAVAGAAWAGLRSRATEFSLEPLRSQLASDAALLREAGDA